MIRKQKLIRASKLAQRVYRGHLGRCEFRRVLNKKLRREREEILATTISRTYRGHVARTDARARRKARNRMLLLERVRDFQRNRSVKLLQRAFRGYRGRKQAEGARMERRRVRLEARRRLKASIRLQYSFRCALARQELARRLAQRQHETFVRCVIRIQSRARGYRDREVYREMVRKRERDALENYCAVVIQGCWRRWRSRHKAEIVRSIENMRILEDRSSRLVQRAYRGFRGRVMFREILELNKARETRTASAMILQRAWRGFKGRQVFEVFLALKNARDLTQPIKDRIEKFERERDEISKQVGLLKRRHDKAKTRLNSQSVELRTVSKIGSK